jgi:hypothetical protein
LLNFTLKIRTNFNTFEVQYPYRADKPSKDDLTHFLIDRKRVAKNGKHIEGEISFPVKDMAEFDHIRETTLTITDAWQNKHNILQWGEPSFITKVKRQKEIQVYLDELNEIYKNRSED